MTKILFISHGMNDSGWGNMCRNLTDVLSYGFEIATRVIPISQKSTSYVELSNKDLNDVTHVIQYVLPNHYIRYPNVKNISIVESEYENVQFSEWLEYYELMDQVLTTNSKTLSELKKWITPPVKLLNHYINTQKYLEEYKELDIPEINGSYNFYTIAKNTPRKNLTDLLRAYHTEFDPTEPVNLLIKSDKSVLNLCNSVKKELGLYVDESKYDSEFLLLRKMTDNQIYSLHKLSNCYINTSIGESFGIPMIDAIGFGNDVVTHNNGLIKGNVSYGQTIARGGDVFSLENSRNIANQIDILDLMSKMRKAYEGKLEKQSYNFRTKDEYCKIIAKILQIKD